MSWEHGRVSKTLKSDFIAETFSRWNRGEIGIKLRAKQAIYQKLQRPTKDLQAGQNILRTVLPKALKLRDSFKLMMSVFCILFLNNEEHDLSLKNGFIFHDFQFYVLLLTSRARKLKL